MKKAKKVAAKKPAKTVTVKAVDSESDLNLWHVSCQIEDQTMKIIQSKDFLSIIASHDSGPESNALWLLFDFLEDVEVNLTKIAEEVMAEYRKSNKTDYVL